MALLTAEAIPASVSLASASTVAVSGATVSDRPNENTSSAGSTSVEERHRRPVALHEREPRGHEQRSDGEERARPVAVRQPAHARRQQEHHHGGDEPGDARLERAPARHLLQVDGDEEPEQADPAVHDERLRVGHGEVAVAKQLERQHRHPGVRLVPDEGGEEHEAGQQRAPHAGVRPPQHRLLDQPERDPGQPERGERRRPVQSMRTFGIPWARPGHGHARQHQGDDDQRHVDDEDPAPRGRVDELAADDRPGEDPDAAPRRPGPDRPAALLLGEDRRR